MVGSFGDFEGENDSYTTVVLTSYQVVYLYFRFYLRLCNIISSVCRFKILSFREKKILSSGKQSFI